jgi:protein-arginine kinase activator protein McsA
MVKRIIENILGGGVRCGQCGTIIKNVIAGEELCPECYRAYKRRTGKDGHSGLPPTMGPRMF